MNTKTLAAIALAGSLSTISGAAMAQSYNDGAISGKTADAQEQKSDGFPEIPWGTILYGVAGAFVGITLLTGFRVVRPTEEGIVERLGKYKRTSTSGLTYVLPFGIDKMYRVPTQEVRMNIPPEAVITNDKLNAEVDAMVYYRVRDTRKALYEVQNYQATIPSLAQTTLRSVIGTMTLAHANEQRQEINRRLQTELATQTSNWGIDILRVELQKIEPPSDVQATMNNVVKAEQLKIAARDTAEAAETQADGERRAAIKAAEGKAKAVELEATAQAMAVRAKANAEADAIRVVNESADKYFTGNAQAFRRLQVAENALRNNTKYIIPQGTDLVTVLGDGSEKIVPVTKP